MEIIIVFNLKFQNIVLIVQHREMNVLLDTFLIRIVRELFISTISSNNRIRTGNNGKVYDLSVITQYFKCITGFQRSRNIGRLGYIMAELPNTFQIGRFEFGFLLGRRTCYR